MKQIKKIILIFILYFLSLNIASALTFGGEQYVLKNVKTGELKIIENRFPFEEYDGIIQNNINHYFFTETIGDNYFENWILKCYTYSNNEIDNEKGNCEDLNQDKELNKITISDLSTKDKLNLYGRMAYNYLILYLFCLPFNFFVFFSITYPIFGTKFSLKMHLTLSILLTIIMDLILIYFELSFMQLIDRLMLGLVYVICIFLPKFVLSLLGYYFYRKYKKLTQK